MNSTISPEELHYRLALDFTKTYQEVLSEIVELMPQVSEQQIESWRHSGVLEYLVIDNEDRYFRRAARNVFRVDPIAREFFCNKYGDEKKGRALFLTDYLPKIIDKNDEKTFNFRFKIKIKSQDNEELMRAWLPYPAECKYQKLIGNKSNRGLCSGRQSGHSSIYFQKHSHSTKETIFETEYTFLSRSSYYKNNINISESYDVDDLQEQTPHIVFSEKIRDLSEVIVSREKDKLLIAKRIFTWISQNISWAVAREYSTIENIPHYVIDNRHGDCGQVTLLFMTLCRHNNIPTRWLSGFMLYPGYENLHDWCEIFIENYGWQPVDVSFGIQNWAEDEELKYFYFMGIDPYRLVVNTKISDNLFPKKNFIRSETVDFQRGEVETESKNLYFDSFSYEFENVEIRKVSEIVD